MNCSMYINVVVYFVFPLRCNISAPLTLLSSMSLFIPTMVILQDLRSMDAKYREFIKTQREAIFATTYPLGSPKTIPLDASERMKCILPGSEKAARPCPIPV